MKRNEQNIKEQNESSKQKRIGRWKIAAGILLIVVGIAAILSAILIPAANRKQNDQAIADIKAGKYAKQEEEITPEAVTPEAIIETETTSEAVTEAPSEREIKMAQIMEDGTKIGIVEIEKIDVLYAIVEGTEDAQINRAIGHLTTSAGIGEKGNCVIGGHRGGYYGTFFERLPELEQGDEIILTDLNGKEYHYAVYEKKLVEAADWSVTKDLDDKYTLTLITCEDDTRKRIIVSAVLFEP